jgi:replication initiation and membrane attachment protein DnaB
VWKLRIGKAMENLDPAKVDQQLEVVSDQVKVMNDIAADVTAGKIKSADEATQTLQARLRQAIMQSMEKQHKTATQATTAPTTEPAKP